MEVPGEATLYFLRHCTYVPYAKLSAISESPATRLAVNAPWLVKLRWVALIGQMATIAFVVYALDIPLAAVPLAYALAVTGATNLALDRWVRRAVRHPGTTNRHASMVIAGVMLLDLVVLTAMLYMTGGPTNPFVVFYFVNLALAAVLLEPPLAWLLEGVACAWHAALVLATLAGTGAERPRSTYLHGLGQ